MEASRSPVRFDPASTTSLLPKKAKKTKPVAASTDDSSDASTQRAGPLGGKRKRSPPTRRLARAGLRPAQGDLMAAIATQMRTTSTLLQIFIKFVKECLIDILIP